MDYVQNEWLVLPEDNTTITPDNRLLQIDGFSGSEYMILFREIGRSPIWTPTNPFNTKAPNPTGESITSFSVTDAPYLEREIVIKTTSGDKRLTVRSVGGLDYVSFGGMAVIGGISQPYTFYKGVTYLVPSIGFIKATKQLVTADVALVKPGLDFELLSLASLYDIAKLNNRIDNLPPKMPLIYGVTYSGEIINGNSLDEVSDLMPDYSGRIKVNVDTELKKDTVLGATNLVQGNDYSLQMRNHTITFAGAGIINDYVMSFGTLLLEGFTEHHFSFGFLHNVKLKAVGPRRQKVDLVGTRMSFADGFLSVEGPITITYKGTEFNPRPRWPTNGVLGPDVIISYEDYYFTREYNAYQTVNVFPNNFALAAGKSVVNFDNNVANAELTISDDLVQWELDGRFILNAGITVIGLAGSYCRISLERSVNGEPFKQIVSGGITISNSGFGNGNLSAVIETLYYEVTQIRLTIEPLEPNTSIVINDANNLPFLSVQKI